MANNKKLVEAITSMEDDFAQWYTDVVKKAELCGYTSVKGCMAIKPAGYAIWENIQHELDRRFKETGVQNVTGKELFGCIGEFSQKLYDTVTGIQTGKVEDTLGWTVEVTPLEK